MATTVGPTAAGVVAPTREDPLVEAVSRVAGGPFGRRAAPSGRRFWTVWRVLVALTVLTCTLGWAQKAQCRDTRNWSHADGVYQYTRLCYSDVVALYGSEGLQSGQLPYVDHAVEYPVLIGAAMEAVREVAAAASPSHPIDHGRFSEDQQAATFYDVTVLLLAAAALATVICTGLAAGRRRTWDAALVALAPTVVIHLGTNWDMIAVALATGALAAWARRRPWLAGVLLGLGAATKLYPALLLFPLLLLCLRAGRLRSFWRVAVATLGTAVGIYAVVWPFSPAFASDGSGDPKVVAPSAWQLLTGPGGSLSQAVHALAPHHGGGANGLLRFEQLNQTRTADFDTLWYLLQQVFDKPFNVGPLNLAVAVVMLLFAGGLAGLALLAERRPRLAPLCFLLVAGFLLLNKVDSPQYTLWLLPLAVLARPRWPAFLVWQAAEVLLLVVRFGFFIHLSNAGVGAPYGWFAFAVVLRDGALIALCALVVRDIVDPSRDIVRADGELDDPGGGVLDGAADRSAGTAVPVTDRPALADVPVR